MPDPRLLLLCREVQRTTKEVEDLLKIAEDAQWHRSRNPNGPEEPSRRPKNVPTDRTGETASDTARLRVRHEVRTAERHLLKAAALLRGTRCALDRALNEWEPPESA
jgi:hypothetical protein